MTDHLGSFAIFVLAFGRLSVVQKLVTDECGSADGNDSVMGTIPCGLLMQFRLSQFKEGRSMIRCDLEILS